QTPANRPTTRIGADPIALSRPIWAGVAFRFRIAVKPTADPPTWEPNFEIVWAIQSLTKSLLRQSPASRRAMDLPSGSIAPRTSKAPGDADRSCPRQAGTVHIAGARKGCSSGPAVSSYFQAVNRRLL